jgi:hypothetical protein
VLATTAAALLLLNAGPNLDACGDIARDLWHKRDLQRLPPCP